MKPSIKIQFRLTESNKEAYAKLEKFLLSTSPTVIVSYALKEAANLVGLKQMAMKEGIVFSEVKEKTTDKKIDALPPASNEPKRKYSEEQIDALISVLQPFDWCPAHPNAYVEPCLKNNGLKLREFYRSQTV